MNKFSFLGFAGALWGAAGLCLILLDAINRLSRLALHALDHGMDTVHWVSLPLVVALLAYSEGYRGFQKSFSPRCAARTWYLYRHPDPLNALFAPLFVMGFYRATRKPLLFAWVGTSLIVLLVIVLHQSPQPWRGIIDAGVVAGLSWGLISFLYSTGRAFATGRYPVSPEVPGVAASVWSTRPEQA